MASKMRLFKRRGWFHVEIARNKSRALKTKSEQEAKAIFREMKKAQLKGKLLELDKVNRIMLSEFKKEYVKHREGLKDLSDETIKKDKAGIQTADVHKPSNDCF